jgi:hypothetical protein
VTTQVGAPHELTTHHSPENMRALGLLLVIGFAVFGPAIWFPPTHPEDLLLLSAVARADSPVQFLIGDWGMGNHVYRPLHSLCLWGTYQLAGVSASYYQLTNLLLHLCAVALLYLLVCSVQRDRALALVLTALMLVSLYTVSPAIWVSDRPTLFVAVSLLLLLHAWKIGEDGHDPPSARVLGASLFMLSCAAVMGKESGVIVPLFGAAWATAARPRILGRFGLVMLAVLFLLGYGLFRVSIFGPEAFGYTESGYLLGRIPYDSWRDLAPPLRSLALLENSAKNVLAVFLPIFTGFGGALMPVGALARTVLIWLPVALLAIAAARRPLSSFQRAGLLIVILNGVTHYAVFRYRTLYLAQLGFILFLAGARYSDSETRRRLAGVLATVALLGNLIWVSRDMNAEVVSRNGSLTVAAMKSMVARSEGRIDEKVVDRIVRQYGAE